MRNWPASFSLLLRVKALYFLSPPKSQQKFKLSCQNIIIWFLKTGNDLKFWMHFLLLSLARSVIYKEWWIKFWRFSVSHPDSGSGLTVRSEFGIHKYYFFCGGFLSVRLQTDPELTAGWSSNKNKLSIISSCSLVMLAGTGRGRER